MYAYLKRSRGKLLPIKRYADFLTTEGGSLFEGSSGKEELSCSIPGGVASIRSVCEEEVAFIFGIFG